MEINSYFANGVLLIITLSVIYVGYMMIEMYKREGFGCNFEQEVTPLKTVKLYCENGKLLQTYKSVYLSHSDTNIYNLYTKKGGKHILMLKIGANMLLTAEEI